MKTKFTPGPWETCDAWGPSKDGICIGELAAQQKIIASCTGYYGRETSQANARLIAAAPELYEALKDLLEELATGEDYGDELVFALDKARAALAKVESQ
jgi:hypothetical protein